MSGTCLIDLSSGGDLQRFLSVNGSHDLALDSMGLASTPVSFSAYPWSLPSPDATFDDWKNVDAIERRAASGRMVEEWLRIYDECHGTRNDLATNFDALDAWELPSDGSAAGALNVGGTQFNGHVFCKRSWWLHVTRNRYCIERAISNTNLWTGVSTPDSLAESYINTTRAWSTSAGPTPIIFGKFNWALGWRNLLFPWSPAVNYATPQNNGGGHVYQLAAGWEYDAGFGGGDPDWDTTSASFGFSGSLASTGAAAGIGASPGITGIKSARWIVFAGQLFNCSSGSTITRPQTSLRNLFGFDENTILRLKINNYTQSGSATCDIKLGFFWYDASDPASDWPYRLIKDESTILGTVSGSESNITLGTVVDQVWNATAGVSSGIRIPCFWIGPAWGVSIPSPQSPDPPEAATCTGSAATDNAATAGVNHHARWNTDQGGGFVAPRVGTSMHPFNSTA